MTTGQLPAGRYGRRRSGRRSRRIQLLGMVLAGLAGLVVAMIGYRNLGEVAVQSQVLGFELVEPNAVALRFEVVRDDPDRPAVCVVRARSRDGEETGRKEVYVPPAAGSVGLNTVILTSRPPVTADVYGCSLQVPEYLVPSTAP
ncbi:MAG: DUF4307 domain-containing protein [Pseudonocardiaceae bacterium]